MVHFRSRGIGLEQCIQLMKNSRNGTIWFHGEREKNTKLFFYHYIKEKVHKLVPSLWTYTLIASEDYASAGASSAGVSEAVSSATLAASACAAAAAAFLSATFLAIASLTFFSASRF